MRKQVLLLSCFAGISAFAQTARFGNLLLNPSSEIAVSPGNIQAAGDTVFIYDGYFYYDVNGTLPVTFNIQAEDNDGLTINSVYQPYFGTTASFVVFNEIAPGSPYAYSHPDTVYFLAATSYFSSPGLANDWVEFGPIHVPASGGTLMWRHHMANAGFRNGYEVRVNTTGIGSANFTNAPVFSVADNDPSTIGDTVTTPTLGWYQRTASVDVYAGQDIYLAFHHNSNDQDLIFFTDIILVESGNVTGLAQAVASPVSVFPNPANSTCVFSYYLTQGGEVSVKLFNLNGELVMEQQEMNPSAGKNAMQVDLSSLVAGVYYYTLSANGVTETRKLVITR
jgi:hypothetical protein